MKLTHVTALSFREHFPSGRTAPMLIEAADTQDNRQEVVMKVFSSSEGSHGAAIIELVCSLIAKELELNPPDPYLVDLPDGFVDTLPQEQATKLTQNSGPYFGTHYIPGVSIVVPHRSIPSDKEEEASAIFTFDYLIQNPDRRIGKPNLLEHDDGYHLIDHDQALAHLILPIIGGSLEPWDKQSIGALSFSYMKNHLFRAGLKGKEKTFQAFRETMANFDSSKLEVILDQVPEIWWNAFDIRDKLSEYLANIPTESSNISTLAQSHLQQ